MRRYEVTQTSENDTEITTEHTAYQLAMEFELSDKEYDMILDLDIGGKYYFDEYMVKRLPDSHIPLLPDDDIESRR